MEEFPNKNNPLKEFESLPIFPKEKNLMSGASISFSASGASSDSKINQSILSNFLNDHKINLREAERNILKGFTVSTPKIDKDNKMLGATYYDLKDGYCNEDLFRIGKDKITHLKPSDVKNEYPEYNGYHTGDKSYLE